MIPSASASRLRIAAVLFLCVAGFYWKLTLTRQFEWMSGPDLAEQVLPWFNTQAHEWHAGRLPLWDPYLWTGQPVVGQAITGAAYPLNWILFLLPLQNGHIAPWALNWYFVIIHLMAASFAYLLCRDLGRSQAAALCAGLIFAFSGFLGNTAWPVMMNGAVWAPLVFLFQLRVARGVRPLANAALSGMCLGIAFLSGHHQVPIFIGLAWAGLWIWILAGNRRLLVPAAVSGLIAGLTGAMQTLPMVVYGHLARRWVGAPESLGWDQTVPYFVHAQYDLKAFSLFGIVFPGVKMHFDPFLGIVALSLALLAVTTLWRESRVRILAAIAGGALVYTLGHNSVFQGFLYGLVPGLDKARSSSAAVAVFQCAAAALAAFGVDALPQARTTRFSRYLAFFGIFTLALAQYVIFTSKLTFPLDDRVILTGVYALLAAAIFTAVRRHALNTSQANILIVFLLLFELGNFAQYNLNDRSDRNQMQWLDKTYANADIGDYLRQQPGFQRTEVANDAFAPNWGEWHGVEMHGGKVASVLSNVLDTEFFGLDARRMFGVAYTIAAAPTPDAGDLVFTGASGMKVFRRDAFPRAWAVHHLVRVPDIATANTEFTKDPQSFRTKATIFAAPPRVEACGAAPDTVQLIQHDADRLLIRANLACDGMVVLSDAFYPGWRARVDHRPAEIFQVNGAMRGVAVPRGTHTVTMRYSPVPVYLGAALTLLGILSALITSRHRKGAI